MCKEGGDDDDDDEETTVDDSVDLSNLADFVDVLSFNVAGDNTCVCTTPLRGVSIPPLILVICGLIMRLGSLPSCDDVLR